jgi:hypothetical protein
VLVVSYTTVSSLPLLLTAVYFLWHLSRGLLRDISIRVDEDAERGTPLNVGK